MQNWIDHLEKTTLRSDQTDWSAVLFEQNVYSETITTA